MDNDNPNIGNPDKAFVDYIRMVETKLSLAESLLREIANSSDVLDGGSRLLHGNDELYGLEQFYRGYNAGIDSQHKHQAAIAKRYLERWPEEK